MLFLTFFSKNKGIGEKMELNEKDIAELKKIIHYGYHEERRHYEEGDNALPHIYTSFEHFNKKLNLGLGNTLKNG